jgi:hypothetical protein
VQHRQGLLAVFHVAVWAQQRRRQLHEHRVATSRRDSEHAVASVRQRIGAGRRRNVAERQQRERSRLPCRGSRRARDRDGQEKQRAGVRADHHSDLALLCLL